MAQRTARDRTRWLAGYFPASYPVAEVTEAEAVHDVLFSAGMGVRRTVYECESCGRLWVQAEPNGTRFRACAPEEPGTGAPRPVGE